MSAERRLLKLRKVLDNYCYTQYNIIFLMSELTLGWYFLACNSESLKSSLIKKKMRVIITCPENTSRVRVIYFIESRSSLKSEKKIRGRTRYNLMSLGAGGRRGAKEELIKLSSTCLIFIKRVDSTALGNQIQTLKSYLFLQTVLT